VEIAISPQDGGVDVARKEVIVVESVELDQDGKRGNVEIDVVESTSKLHIGENGSALNVDAKSARVLVLLRGAPGSGKSTLAKQVLSEYGGQGEVYSTDDFFLVDGKYVYNIIAIGQAHEWNQARALAAMEKGISPVLVDNTNTQKWEAKAYVEHAVRLGYKVDVRETATPWAKDPVELAKRNVHGVPQVAIERMLARWENDFTPENILAAQPPKRPARNRSRSPSSRSRNHSSRSPSRADEVPGEHDEHGHGHKSSEHGYKSDEHGHHERGRKPESEHAKSDEHGHDGHKSSAEHWQKIPERKNSPKVVSPKAKAHKEAPPAKKDNSNVFALLGDDDE